jgi:hypothetical protein
MRTLRYAHASPVGRRGYVPFDFDPAELQRSLDFGVDVLITDWTGLQADILHHALQPKCCLRTLDARARGERPMRARRATKSRRRVPRTAALP